MHASLSLFHCHVALLELNMPRDPTLYWLTVEELSLKVACTGASQ